MRHLNVYTSKSSKVVDLTRKVRKGNISPENWDYILGNETEPFIIHLSENGDVNDNWDKR